MPANADDQCIVYYIGLPGSDPHREGYVGITKNEDKRKGDHRRSGKFPGAIFSVLFRGTRRECAAIEAQYRPQPKIGWNTSHGGGRWRRNGIRASQQET